MNEDNNENKDEYEEVGLSIQKKKSIDYIHNFFFRYKYHKSSCIVAITEQIIEVMFSFHSVTRITIACN